MLTPPLFCALCSGRGGLSLYPETDTTAPVPKPDPATWESRWFGLQVSEGLVNASREVHPQSEPTSPLQFLSPPSTPTSAAADTYGRNNKRTVVIHQYCLDCVLSTVQRSMYNDGFSHEENLVLAWSIPKWTGHGDWSTPVELQSTAAPIGTRFQTGRVRSAYWLGTESQRTRWDQKMEGSHLLPVRPFVVQSSSLLTGVQSDLASPEDIGRPNPTQFPSSATRFNQTSRLLSLPEHLLVHIALDLLRVPQIPNDTNTNSTSRLLLVNVISDLLAFLRTSFDLRHLSPPSWLWKRILFDSVARFKLGLLSRWRAIPTGVGSTIQLAIALDQAFSVPIEKAFDEVEHDREGFEDAGPVPAELGVQDVFRWWAQDVFRWWAYSEGWRSRRRVWYCVVHACATARDADWW